MKVFVRVRAFDSRGVALSSKHAKPYSAIVGCKQGNVWQVHDLSEKAIERLVASSLFEVRLDDPRPKNGRKLVVLISRTTDVVTPARDHRRWVLS